MTLYGCGATTRPPCAFTMSIDSSTDKPGGTASFKNRPSSSPSDVDISSPTIILEGASF